MNGLGVGVLYNDALARYIDEHPRAVDFLAVSPERCWSEQRRDVARRFVPLPAQVAALDVLGERYPLIARGIELPLASASVLDVPRVEQLAHWRGRFDFRWLSVEIPRRRESLERLAERVRTVQRMLDCRVILGHAAIGEAELLNRLCALSGAGVLLDLHELERRTADPAEFVDALELANVVEIHASGEPDGSGSLRRCPLDRVLPRCPNLRGITLELRRTKVRSLDEDRIAAQLAAARTLWKRHRGLPPW